MKALALLLLAAVSSSGAVLDVPLIKQKRNGCGAAAVAMVMKYWAVADGPAAGQVHEELFEPGLRAIRLSEMRAYLERHGFRAFTLRGQTADLERHLAKGRPIIVGLKKKPSDDYHFAVVVGIGDDGVWLNDPARTKPHRMDRSKFEKRWALADRWLLLATP